jgi:hypothetical protein
LEFMGMRSTGILMESGILPLSNSAGDLTSMITPPLIKAAFMPLFQKPNHERIDITRL